VTFAEIRFGIETSSNRNKRAELNEWLERRIRPIFGQRALPITEDVMLRWRILVEDERRAGHTFLQPDLIIAATALQHDLTIVSRDKREYAKARAAVLNPLSDSAP
jgi:predicted nucleic acid-binding protein